MEHATVRFEGADGSNRAVLDDVDWIIGPGDRYGIVGENGAGKTTLLRVIQGLQRLDAGRVKIGQTVRFAVLSQHLDDLSRFGSDRVRQVIGRYSRRTMLDGKEVTPAQLLEKLGFSRDDLNEPVCDLSGGQKRRLALMLILLDEPNVLVLDERATTWTPTCWPWWRTCWTAGRARCFWSRTTATSWNASPITSSRWWTASCGICRAAWRNT